MKNKKKLSNLLGPWKDNDIKSKFSIKKHKFLDRNRTLKINWKRLHDKIPEILLSDERLNLLDVACGNGATMEILRYYGHSVQGVDFSPGFSKDNWLYKPMIKSQKLKCLVHNCSIIPYPFKDKEFDYLICYGAITFFKPIENWPKIMNEFARISKRGILVGVNNGKVFDNGKKYLDNWKHPDFKLISKTGSIYKWGKK